MEQTQTDWIFGSLWGMTADVASRHSGSARAAQATTADQSASRVIAALVYHCFRCRGVLSSHYGMLWGHGLLSDAALSKRRLAMPVKVFEEVLRAALVPLAGLKEHPGCFYRGLRLIAVDGTEFSVSNTPRFWGS